MEEVGGKEVRKGIKSFVGSDNETLSEELDFRENEYIGICVQKKKKKGIWI